MSDMTPLTDRPRPRFNPEITLGHLLSAGTMIVTMIVGYATLNSRVGVIESQISAMAQLMERSIRTDEQLRYLRTQADKQDERIQRLEHRP